MNEWSKMDFAIKITGYKTFEHWEIDIRTVSWPVICLSLLCEALFKKNLSGLYNIQWEGWKVDLLSEKLHKRVFVDVLTGGLVCRGILSTLSDHNVHSFISLSSPQAGQYGGGSNIESLVQQQVLNAVSISLLRIY